MRRGIGVAHVQKKQETQKHMADLGAQITAERVGQIADELETLEGQLRALARKHSEEIKHDPVARARFRQLADSLGIDLISSKKNVFASALGLGDFYYSLAGKVVEACMKERKFFGSFVPLHRTVQVLQRQLDAAASNNGKRVLINDGDVSMALQELHILGEGYNVVKLNGVKYIQTTPDGNRSVEDIPLLEVVLAQRTTQLNAYRATRQVESQNHEKSAALRAKAPNRFRIGGQYINLHQPSTTTEAVSEHVGTDIPLLSQYVAFTQSQLEERLVWQPYRVQGVLERMVQDGSVWVESPPATKGAVFSAVEDNMSSQGKGEKKKRTTAKEETVYWFVSFSGGGGENV